ncbi:MurR/RpiR family transcriptional regulator [Nocardioides sp.]|uniref:MurR/RpiR family transcriptional regulator n=1 Tax=Nocardioides sp. TaxID=35761 RepID=UPI0035159D51
MTLQPAPPPAPQPGRPVVTGRIDERIAARRPDLSPQERRAAATLLEHLDDLATYRASELAALAGVSKATMSRLFRSLGFADFDEVRDHLRGLHAARSAGEPGRTDDRETGDVAAHARADAEAVRRAVEHPQVGRAVGLLAEARRVTVLGWRNSHPVALHLRQQLAQVRDGVRLAPLPGQVIGEELAELGPGDAIVAVGFRRRPGWFGEVLGACVDTGAATVLLADATAAPHAAAVDVWLECPVTTRLAFDSYAAAMSLVAVLADGVLERHGPAAQQRIGAISRTYDRLGEVER